MARWWVRSDDQVDPAVGIGDVVQIERRAAPHRGVESHEGDVRARAPPARDSVQARGIDRRTAVDRVGVRRSQSLVEAGRRDEARMVGCSPVPVQVGIHEGAEQGRVDIAGPDVVGRPQLGDQAVPGGCEAGHQRGPHRRSLVVGHVDAALSDGMSKRSM